MSSLENIAKKYGGRIEGRRNFKVLVVEAKKLKDVISELRNSGYDYLLTISGVDEPQAKRIRIVYHLTKTSNPSDVVAVEVSVSRDNPVVDSIHDMFEGALLQEREEHEMLGIVFRGNPDTRHLLLPPDWPPGVYPLRKDFKVVDEPHTATRPSKPVWVLKPELKPKEGSGQQAKK